MNLKKIRQNKAVRLQKEFGPLCSNEAVIRPLFKIAMYCA